MWTEERFLRQAARSPEATALLDDGDRWSYARLDGAAAGLARRLAEAGVRPGSLVALAVPHGWRVVAGILGIWRHGCAYVPIDPAYPAARRDYIAEDSRAAAVVVAGPDGGLIVRHRPAAAPRELPDGLAYVMYTSGSTGRPKGVAVTHDNLAALLDSAAGVLPVGPGDTGTAFHSYCFDLSVWETWPVLTAGGCLLMVPAAARTDPHRLAGLLAEHRVTRLTLVPSVFAGLVRAAGEAPVALPALREVALAGEAMNLAVARTWFALAAAPQARILNLYGPTECTVHAMLKTLTAERLAAFRGPGTPIGGPLPHMRVAVLDDDGAEVAAGVTGEVHFAGTGVAAGYLGRPELTAERFVRRAGQVWYRTGDLARRGPDGELVFLGRRDGQLKLRGHRIEPGEVEAALGELPDVSAAGVGLAVNRAGDPVLVACYVPAGPAARSPARLRAELSERLPGYLVPARLVPVDELPVTAHGKLDRAAVTAAAAPVPPAGKWQSLVAEAWAPELGYRPDELSATDDFLDLGGHSLAAGRVAARLSRALGAPLPVRLLFDHPVLADLADAVASSIEEDRAHVD